MRTFDFVSVQLYESWSRASQATSLVSPLYLPYVSLISPQVFASSESAISPLLMNEYIVYHTNQGYPEYMVEFELK